MRNILSKFFVKMAIFMIVAQSVVGFMLSGAKIAEAEERTVVINEFVANPIGDEPENEWIELYNPSDTYIDVSLWELNDSTGDGYILPLISVIPANGYMIIAGQSSIELNNGGDTITLKDSESNTIDEVIYPSVAEGYSYSRIPNGQDTDNFSADFQLSDTPTIYAINDLTKPVISDAKVYIGAKIGTDSTFINHLSANWTGFVDAESGIYSYEYAISTLADGSDIVSTSWKDTGLNTSVIDATISPVENQIYYFFVRAINNSGQISDMVISSPATYDHQAPTVAVITSGIYDIATKKNSINWTPGTDDNIIKEQLVLRSTTDVDDNYTPISTSLNNSITLFIDEVLADYTNYFYKIETTDDAGNKIRSASVLVKSIEKIDAPMITSVLLSSDNKTISLKYTVSPGTVKTQIQIAKDSAFSQIVKSIEQTQSVMGSYIAQDLEAGFTYFFRITGYDALGASITSQSGQAVIPAPAVVVVEDTTPAPVVAEPEVAYSFVPAAKAAAPKEEVTPAPVEEKKGEIKGGEDKKEPEKEGRGKDIIVIIALLAIAGAAYYGYKKLPESDEISTKPVIKEKLVEKPTVKIPEIKETPKPPTKTEGTNLNKKKKGKR